MFYSEFLLSFQVTQDSENLQKEGELGRRLRLVEQNINCLFPVINSEAVNNLV